ncbi:unnamed protein product [Schistosoma margrebowiei]|uniref:Uncharacterized protein n=1 Tax=Schistosoma margrebowiei TaxID=48269 RepID=A0A183MYU0_9TREM|nr:unnamed protein product [Schistosoma margrebowiei]
MNIARNSAYTCDSRCTSGQRNIEIDVRFWMNCQ